MPLTIFWAFSMLLRRPAAENLDLFALAGVGAGSMEQEVASGAVVPEAGFFGGSAFALATTAGCLEVGETAAPICLVSADEGFLVGTEGAGGSLEGVDLGADWPFGVASAGTPVASFFSSPAAAFGTCAVLPGGAAAVEAAIEVLGAGVAALTTFFTTTFFPSFSITCVCAGTGTLAAAEEEATGTLIREPSAAFLTTTFLTTFLVTGAVPGAVVGMAFGAAAAIVVTSQEYRRNLVAQGVTFQIAGNMFDTAAKAL